MRLSEKTSVMTVVFLVLAVAVGLGLWYMDVREQTQTQHALEQTRDAFERFERERRGPNEVVTAPGATAPPAALPAPAQPATANPGARDSRPAGQASSTRTANQPEIYYLLAALLLTALVALALAGSSYRLVRRERLARMEDRHVVRETVVERAPVFRPGEGTIIDAEPVETVADGTPVYSPDPPPPASTLETLREWLEQTPLAVLMMRPSGEIEAVNSAFTRLTGYTPNDLPNVQAWLARGQRIPGDRQAAARDALRARYHQGSDAPAEMTVWTRGGEPLHWLAHTAAVRVGGDDSAWLLMASDITARRRTENAAVERAEQARHEAEEMAALYRDAPVGLAVLDTQFRFVRVNERLAQMNGLQPADHLGRPLRKVLPHVASAAEPILERVLQTGAPSTNAWIAVRTPASPKTGQHWSVSCSPLKDAGGRVTRIAFAAEDVTDRREAEAHTRENESTLRTIFERLPAPICVKDTQGRYLYANPAYETFVHVAAGQLKGRMDHEVLPWEAADRLRDADDEALSAAQAVQSRGTVELREAKIEYAAAKIALRDDDGKPQAVCAIYNDLTAQQRAERDIREAEARYRAIFESSPQPMFIDRDNRLVHVNAACVRLLAARDEQQLLGKSILEFIQQPGHKPFQERIQRVLRRKPSEGPLAVSVLRLDNTVIEAEIDTALYETGTERAVQIVVRDVTARSRADAALRGSEAKLRRVVEEAPALIRMSDASGSTTYCNLHWQRLTGLTAEQGGGERWLQQVHADDRDRVARAWRDMRAQRGATHLEYRLHDRDGEYRWLLDIVTPRFDDAGTYLGCISCATDIQERKTLEEGLRRDAERYAMVAERAPALLWVESGGRLELVNHAMRATLGLVDHEAGPWTERIHADDRPLLDERRQAAMRGGNIEHVELRVRDAGGSYRSMVATLAAQAGTAERLVGSLTDVTELRAARLAAHDADARRNAFVAALASDMRTPMEPLRHAAEVLRHAAHGDRNAQEASDIVVRQAQYLARLLDDALDGTHLLAGSLPLHPEALEVGELVHRAAAVSRPMIEARGLALNVALSGGRAQVRVDPDRAVQALARLLDHCARTASPEHGIMVRAEEHGDAALVHVVARDAAVPEDEVATMFEFFPDSSAAAPLRAGFALPLVRHLVEAQGGRVSAAATAEGLRYTLALPLHDIEAQADAPAASRPINGHRRVLVVDRDPDTAASLRMLLQLQGHDVRVARDRAAALPAAQEFHPDTVVIDSTAATGAPGELVRALRLLPETAHAALLCVSSEAAPDDPAQEGLYDHYLVKPVEPSVLQQVLAQSAPTVH